MRYLTSGLIAEDQSDISFLQPVLQARLQRIALAEGFDAGQVQVSDVAAVRPAEAVARAARELLECCDIVFVHRDAREARSIESLRRSLGVQSRIVGVVPVRETEAWAIAAACSAGSAIPRCDTAVPERGWRWVEQLEDPKAELRRRHGGRRGVEELFALIAERADLDRMAELPAYQTFLQDLTRVLKELNFR